MNSLSLALSLSLSLSLSLALSRSLSLPVERPRGTLRRTCYSAKPGFSQSITGSTRQISSRHHSQSTLGNSHQTDIKYHTKSLTLLFCSACARGNLTYTYTHRNSAHGTGGYSYTQVDQYYLLVNLNYYRIKSIIFYSVL